MNRWIRTLNGLMEKKITLYDHFIGLLQKEWDSITAYSLEPLQTILVKKERLVLQMQELEKQRSRIMEKVATALGTTPDGLTLKKLVQMREDPLNEKLARNRKQLLDQISAINELNTKIKRLIDRSSLSFKKSLAFIHSVHEVAASPYRPDGRVGKGKIESRMLSMDV